MSQGFFPDPADEDDLELRNQVFWQAMIDHIRKDKFLTPPRRVLDIGCHRGGLLALIAGFWKPQLLIGIEPADAARARAQLRLNAVAKEVVLLPPSKWQQVRDSSVDLVVCHEVLFLLPDLEPLVTEIARVLAEGGRAYIATGCHIENPVWPQWKTQLDALGLRTFNHDPLALMASAARAGLLASVRPLRDQGGWATHDPTAGGFTFPSVAALLDHQFRHKLLFRLSRR